MVSTTECRILFEPESEDLKFLPEGPYSLPNSRLSWVGIQHGPKSTEGSINILDPQTGINESHLLPGRPGFAFPTSRADVFVCGVERSLGLYNCRDNQWTELCGGIDNAVDNTIINDGMVWRDNLIFGCKDLEFATHKAGLYLWRQQDQKLIQLRDDQICSNGKAVLEDAAGNLSLIDIDSPSKTITISALDIDAGTLGEAKVIVDLTAGSVFPDGMILTPDQKSLIVALYDPGDPDFGVARQYDLETGELQAIWTCPGSPCVTCPQLIPLEGGIKLLLTTAVEHMEAERRSRHSTAGCLFIGDTNFQRVSEQPVFELA